MSLGALILPVFGVENLPVFCRSITLRSIIADISLKNRLRIITNPTRILTVLLFRARLFSVILVFFRDLYDGTILELLRLNLLERNRRSPVWCRSFSMIIPGSILISIFSDHRLHQSRARMLALYESCSLMFWCFRLFRDFYFLARRSVYFFWLYLQLNWRSFLCRLRCARATLCRLSVVIILYILR